MSSATTPRSSSAKKKVSRASAVAIGAMKRGSSGKKKPRAGGAGAGERSPSATAPGGADESSSPADARSAPREDTTRAAVRGATRESVTFADDATSPAAATPRAIEITERIPTGVPAERSPRDAPPPPSPARTHSSHSSLGARRVRRELARGRALGREGQPPPLGVALAGGGANTARQRRAQPRQTPRPDRRPVPPYVPSSPASRTSDSTRTRRAGEPAWTTPRFGRSRAETPRTPPNPNVPRTHNRNARSLWSPPLAAARDGSNRVSPAPHDPPAGPTSAAATVGQGVPAGAIRHARKRVELLRSALLWQRAAHAAIKDLREGFNLQRVYKSAPVGPLDEGEGEGEGLGDGRGGSDADETQQGGRCTSTRAFCSRCSITGGNELAGKGAINMNVSSEGVDDLSDLQEMGLILRLKLATKEHYTTTSYQVLPAGVAALRSMKQSDKDLVDEFLERGVSTGAPRRFGRRRGSGGARRRAARGGGAPPLGGRSRWRSFPRRGVRADGPRRGGAHLLRDGFRGRVVRVLAVPPLERPAGWGGVLRLGGAPTPTGRGSGPRGGGHGEGRRGSPGPFSSERPRGSSTPETTRRGFRLFAPGAPVPPRRGHAREARRTRCT